MIRRFLCLLVMMVALCSVRAASADSIRISLLTCAPGSEIYALFGHSAIRYEDPSRKEDWVFNYGMFSFKDPNFVMRFVKGETDYQLGVIPYRYFEAEYALRGSSVYQQELNLTGAEKQKLITLLRENYLPAHRVYRYNYFYDNCTTRARDKIEESIQEKWSIRRTTGWFPIGISCMSLRPVASGANSASTCVWAVKPMNRLMNASRCLPLSICWQLPEERKSIGEMKWCLSCVRKRKLWMRFWKTSRLSRCRP